MATEKEFNQKQKIIFILLLSASVILINLYCYINDFAIIFGIQLFYLPIILSMICFPKKGLVFSAGFVLLTILFPLIFQKDITVINNSIAMAVMLGVIAVILSLTGSEMKSNRFKLYTLFDGNPTPLAAFDNNGIITDVNEEFEKKTGFKREYLNGKNICDIESFSENSKAAFKEILTNLQKGISLQPYLVQIRKPDFPEEYNVFFITVLSCCNSDSFEKSDIQIASFSDATEKIAAFEKIKESEKKYRDLANLLPQTIAETDIDMKITFMNKKGLETFVLSEDDIKKGEYVKDHLIPEDYNKSLQVFENLKKGTINESSSEYTAIKKDKTHFPIMAYTNLITDKGKPAGIRFAIVDLTKIKKTENALKETENQKQLCIIRSLNEKEILLKEIHHRVKNNLQIIASILKLEDMRSDNEEIHELLLDCRSRVFSMAMIHEKLYRSENLASINFRDYISTLQMHLSEEYGAEERNISLVCNCDDAISLDIDTAIPCGLIVNEILTNSLKYAFDESGGEILTEFHESGNKNYRLRVTDNGKGFPESYDYENSDSLGMQLVFNLTEQLEGEIEVRTNGGVEYIITIPKVCKGH